MTLHNVHIHMGVVDFYNGDYMQSIDADYLCLLVITKWVSTVTVF